MINETGLDFLNAPGPYSPSYYLRKILTGIGRIYPMLAEDLEGLVSSVEEMEQELRDLPDIDRLNCAMEDLESEVASKSSEVSDLEDDIEGLRKFERMMLRVGDAYNDKNLDTADALRERIERIWEQNWEEL